MAIPFSTTFKPILGIKLWRTLVFGGYPVDNPLSALQKRSKSEEENETVEHKKREPIVGSLVANTIK
jgi:hypothetical protein